MKLHKNVSGVCIKCLIYVTYYFSSFIMNSSVVISIGHNLVIHPLILGFQILVPFRFFRYFFNQDCKLFKGGGHAFHFSACFMWKS